MNARLAVAGFASVAVGIGLGRFAYAPVIPELVGHGWVSAPQAAYGGTANLVGYLLGAVLARRLATLLTSPRVVRASFVIVTATLLACAWNRGFAWLAACRLACGLAGGLLVVLAPPLVLAGHPPAVRGRVAGLVFAGFGTAVVMSSFVVSRLAPAGVASIWIAFAVLACALTVAGWTGVPREPPPATPSVPAAGTTRAGVLLVAAYAACAVGFVPHTIFWVDFVARGLGRGTSVGAMHWSLFGAAAIGGPLLAGAIADRLSVGAGFRLAIGGMLVGVALPALGSASPLLAASSLLVGGCSAATTSLGAARAAQIAGGAQGALWARMTVVYAATYAAAGYAMSFYFAHARAYRALFAFGTAGLLGAVLFEAASARAFDAGRATVRKEATG